MENDIEYFIKIFEKQIKFNNRHAHSNIGYGEDVMPILEVYNNLTGFDERKAFKEALILFLKDVNPDKRDFAINLCLGFLIFRDSIGR